MEIKLKEKKLPTLRNTKEVTVKQNKNKAGQLGENSGQLTCLAGHPQYQKKFYITAL